MTNRIERRDLAGIATAARDISLSDGQFFCETPKAYEIWQDEPLLMIKRIPSSKVLAVWIQKKAEPAL